jgi:hypothetical protein
MSNFNKIVWKTKAELARDKIEGEAAELKKKISELEKKIMGRGFIRNAGLAQMQTAKKELVRARSELKKAQKKLDDLGGLK